MPTALSMRFLSLLFAYASPIIAYTADPPPWPSQMDDDLLQKNIELVTFTGYVFRPSRPIPLC